MLICYLLQFYPGITAEKQKTAKLPDKNHIIQNVRCHPELVEGCGMACHILRQAQHDLRTMHVSILDLFFLAEFTFNILKRLLYSKKAEMSIKMTTFATLQKGELTIYIKN